MRLAFRTSYLGNRFCGSQQQGSGRTVEGEFIAACERVGLFSNWRSAGFLSAGRTDRGVHARGQVIAFTTGFPERAVQALNAQLPPDIWCTGYAEVPDTFHPRFDAVSRTYRYYFSHLMDTGTMQEASRHFIGQHNFSNFARVGDKNPCRTILTIRVFNDASHSGLEVKAESFLWHQVRCMAAALQSVATGEEEEAWIACMLEEESNRPIQPAPAEGLILWDTDCGISWTPLPVGDRSCAYLAQLQGHHALMEQVCRVLGDAPGLESGYDPSD